MHINLYNFRNDKIISNIFAEIENNIFVCQTNYIITNIKVCNCCNFNFEKEECNTYCEYKIITNEVETTNLYSPTEDFSSEENLIKYSQNEESSTKDTLTTDTKFDSTTINISNLENIQTEEIPTDNSTEITTSKESSSKMPIGVIIGIIAGTVVLIPAVIVIIICFCKKNKHNPSPSNMNILSKEIRNSNSAAANLREFEYEPQEQGDTQKVKFILETISQYKVFISFDPNKTMKELIQFYFQKIKKPYLYGDPDIRFLFCAKFIPHDSNDLIKMHIKDYNSTYIFVIDDVEDKIKSARIN